MAVGRLACCLAITVSVLGCRQAGRETTHDLIELLPEARVVREVEALDFGERATRIHLGEGWSRDETAPDGTRFIWSLGERSTLRLFVAEPRELAIRFRLWTFDYEGAPAQEVGVEVNGFAATTVAVAGGATEYATTLPETALVAGDNEVGFRYAWHRAPADVVPGAGDRRSLAVAWDWLALDDVLAGGVPIVDGDALSLPAHTRLDYLVTLPENAELGIEDVIPSGDGDWDLTVKKATMTGRREHAVDAAGSAAVALTRDGEPRLARISFQMHGVPASSTATLRLVKPRISRPATDGPPVAPGAGSRRPSILLYVADTLRADHLGVYGYTASPTPRLDALAAEATVFTRAFAQSSWTKASMASVLTGLIPQDHGANARTAPLASSIHTLPERLRDLGYETAGFVTNPNLTEPFGFAEGFDVYEFLSEADPERAYVRSNVLTDRALEWVSEREGGRPFFLFLHTMDPHDPYRSAVAGHGESDAEREQYDGLELGSMAFMKALDDGRLEPPEGVETRLTELYDAEIRFNDEQLGLLLDGLRERGEYDETLIVFLSDHGEEFFEHGWWRHGKTLYQEQLHVPFIVKWPSSEGAGTKVGAAAQHIDVVPTLLDYLGAPEPSFPGRAWRPLVDRGAPPFVTSYLDLDGREVESVVVDDVKLVRYLAHDRSVASVELFRLDDDPAERHNRIADDPSVAEFLTGVLDHVHAGASAPPLEPVEITPELLEQLRHLGYVQ